MFFEEIVKEKYNETYASTYAFYKERVAEQKEQGIQELTRFLNDLYVNEGNDWLGRHEVRTEILAATIAACEAVLQEYKGDEI